MKQPRRTHAVVAGGGTAGHVLPAIAIAEGLIDSGHPIDEIHYMGTVFGIERTLIPPVGLAHTFLKVSGLQRRLTMSNLWFLPRLALAMIRTERVFSSLRPRVVISVGGYASLPAVLVARRRRIPVVVVSYDRLPGRASKLTSRWATACAVAFSDSALPRASHTGAPIRRAVLHVDRRRDQSDARRRLGVPDGRFLVVAVGGSLGSAVINDAVEQLVEAEPKTSTLAVLHVAGSRHDSGAVKTHLESGGPWYRRESFVSDVADLYAAADLLVGRGGASTVHEVAATGVPAILVPWAGAAEDHQRSNVEWLRSQGGAVMVSDGDPSAIVRAVNAVRHDQHAREALSENAYKVGRVHRSGAMAQLIDSVALA